MVGDARTHALCPCSRVISVGFVWRAFSSFWHEIVREDSQVTSRFVVIVIGTADVVEGLTFRKTFVGGD